MSTPWKISFILIHGIRSLVSTLTRSRIPLSLLGRYQDWVVSFSTTKGIWTDEARGFVMQGGEETRVPKTKTLRKPWWSHSTYPFHTPSPWTGRTEGLLGLYQWEVRLKPDQGRVHRSSSETGSSSTRVSPNLRISHQSVSVGTTYPTPGLPSSWSYLCARSGTRLQLNVVNLYSMYSLPGGKHDNKSRSI